ncbi:MAG: hypothetical protein EOP45_14165 [Sphingobacteriaceae bacterium]|nr:MAG: hypothetical protein EOP45_14165 [Sphingobacteriaceae bacterium]
MQYNSGSPERAGKKPFTPGYDTLWARNKVPLTKPKQPEVSWKPVQQPQPAYDFNSDSESDSDSDAQETQQWQPVTKGKGFKAFIYFDTPSHAYKFAMKAGVESDNREAIATFKDVKALNEFVSKAKQQSGFIAENIVNA